MTAKEWTMDNNPLDPDDTPAPFSRLDRSDWWDMALLAHLIIMVAIATWESFRW